jgi:hypothetical protein
MIQIWIYIKHWYLRAVIYFFNYLAVNQSNRVLISFLGLEHQLKTNSIILELSMKILQPGGKYLARVSSHFYIIISLLETICSLWKTKCLPFLYLLLLKKEQQNIIDNELISYSTQIDQKKNKKCIKIFLNWKGWMYFIFFVCNFSLCWEFICF